MKQQEAKGRCYLFRKQDNSLRKKKNLQALDFFFFFLIFV